MNENLRWVSRFLDPMSPDSIELSAAMRHANANGGLTAEIEVSAGFAIAMLIVLTEYIAEHACQPKPTSLSSEEWAAFKEAVGKSWTFFNDLTRQFTEAALILEAGK